MSLCDQCLNDCKVLHTEISICHNYHNPNRRMIDWRCRICNKKTPNMRQTCLNCSAWGDIIFNFTNILGIFATFRETIQKYNRKLEAKQK